MSERAPTDEQLAAEDERRSDVTVPDLLNMDLTDPETPSRQRRLQIAGADSDQVELVGMDLPLRDWRDPEAAG